MKEATIIAALASLATDIERSSGVRVDEARFQWIDVSQVSGPRHIPVQVT